MNKEDKFKKDMDMQAHLEKLKDRLEPFVLEDLEAYAEQNDDIPERVILRVTEILTGMYRNQFNMSIINIIKAFGYGGENYYDNGNGEFDPMAFNMEWMKRGLEFDGE